MLDQVNERLDELIAELTHCKVDETHKVRDKLIDLNQDLESFKKRVCAVQEWVRSGGKFYGGVDINKKEEIENGTLQE